jgi:hypothetical protein
MYKLTTPDITFSFPSNIDMTEASDVYVTFTNKNNKILINKTSENLTITAQAVALTLSQEDTLDFPENDYIKAQVNWTFTDQGVLKRSCTKAIRIMVEENLYPQLIPGE